MDLLSNKLEFRFFDFNRGVSKEPRMFVNFPESYNISFVEKHLARKTET